MNQLETPAQELLSAAESANNVVVPPPAPSKMVKRHNRPEVDHEDDEQQEQDTKRGDYSGNQLGFFLDDTCEPIVNYEGFESVGKPFGMSGLPRFVLADDEDEDVVNVRSPIICKLSGARSSTLSPTCVSALARDEVSKSDNANEPSWTIREFQEYLGMLELLQDVCSSSEGEEMSLSADSLSQMERLLTSLLPQGV